MSNPFQQVLYKEAELEESKTQHPYHVGYSAHGQNKTRQHNPYKEGTEAAAQWAKGWEHASDGKPRVKMSNEEVDTLKGTPVVSLSDLGPKDTKKDKYGRTVPKKLQKDDPRVKFANKDGKIKEEVELEEGRWVTPKEAKPPKSLSTVSLKQLLKNKKENPGQSPFKTQDDKVKKHLGLKEQDETEEVDLNESLAVHGKYTIRTGPVVRDIPEHNPEHVAAHNTRLRQLGVVADAEPGGGNYGSTHRVTVTNNETNEKTHHHVYQSDVSGNKAIMSVRGVGQKNDLHGEHNKVIKDYLSGKKATSKPVQEEVDLDEAVEVSHDRYMRSHSKKASGNGMWMFTHKPMGSVDYKDEKEVHQARGSFSDAAKSAKQWAKSHGHSRVYVMESVELEEAISDSERIAKGKPTSDDVRRKYYSKMVISMWGGKDTEKQKNKSWDRYQKIKSITDPDQKNEEVELEEKTLTPAELKKREEVAKAMEREKPGMPMSKKMAIATAVAKRVAEQYDDAE